MGEGTVFFCRRKSHALLTLQTLYCVNSTYELATNVEHGNVECFDVEW